MLLTYYPNVVVIVCNLKNVIGSKVSETGSLCVVSAGGGYGARRPWTTRGTIGSFDPSHNTKVRVSFLSLYYNVSLCKCNTRLQCFLLCCPSLPLYVFWSFKGIPGSSGSGQARWLDQTGEFAGLRDVATSRHPSSTVRAGPGYHIWSIGQTRNGYDASSIEKWGYNKNEWQLSYLYIKLILLK